MSRIVFSAGIMSNVLQNGFIFTKNIKSKNFYNSLIHKNIKKMYLFEYFESK